MEPRLKSSQKWTALPGEFLKQMRQVFTQAFPEPSKTGRFLGEGRIYKEELLLRIGYLSNGSIAQSNFEVSIEYKADKDNMIGLVHLAIDVTATLFHELFENPEATFPRLWEEFEVEGKSVYIQYSGVNSELERQADLILGEDKGGLVQGEDEDESELERNGLKRILGLDPDEDDDGSGQKH